MIKINFNDKRIYLCENHREILNELQLTSAFIVFDLSISKMSHIIDHLMVSDVQHLIIEGNIEASMNVLSSTFIPISAAGGVVFSAHDEVLFIYRRKKWDLPKGKLDPGETIEECALREVREETGVKRLEIICPLLTTYHIYFDEKFYVKSTYWFKMKSDDITLIPQEAEGIKKAVWIHINNIHFQLNNTYESVVDLFKTI